MVPSAPSTPTLTPVNLPEKSEAGEAPLCPAAHLLEVLGRKHMLSLLHLFFEANPRHFNELRKVVNLSPKTLSDRLKELVALGILDRRPLGGIPPRVEYSLSAKGQGLSRVFASIDAWASDFVAPTVDPVVEEKLGV